MKNAVLKLVPLLLLISLALVAYQKDVNLSNNSQISSHLTGFNFPDESAYYLYEAEIHLIRNTTRPAYGTNIYKGANDVYYYNSDLTCPLPTGYYFDMAGGDQYYYVVNGIVVSYGDIPQPCDGCPTQTIDPYHVNPFVPCSPSGGEPVPGE